MPDVFITLEEAAAFEGITYEAMKKRVQRSPKQHNVKSQAREGGGKDQVLISTSSLSAKARKAWRAAQKVEGSEVIIDKRAQEAVPWYVTADLNQYTEANKKRFYEAVELAARVQDFIDYDGPDRTGYAERYALGLGISPQSLYRYMKNVLEANAWALKLEKEDGKSRDYFRALALCRKPKETGTFPSLTDEQKAIIENIWFDKRFAANLGTIEMLYERFELEAERREWEEYPSIKTVARYIKFLMGQRGAESARFLAANGTREWKNKRMMKGKRDATSLQVMEYVVGDEHTFDFWVQWTAPNGKIKAVRPKLVAWLDMRSRAIIGDVACVNANSQTLKESLVKMIYSNPGGVPHILHVDNGKDTPEIANGAKVIAVPVKGGTTIYQGALVALDASGYAIPGKKAESLTAVGRAEETVTNTGADGELVIRVARGVFVFDNTATSANKITAAHVLKPCYMEDDHTVTALATGASVAGTVIRVDDEGVAVECGGYIPAAAAASVGG